MMEYDVMINWPCKELPILIRIMENNVEINRPYTELPVLIWMTGKMLFLK